MQDEKGEREMMERQAAGRPADVRHVQDLSAAAATVTGLADHHREALTQRLGLKRYVYSALGKAAHHPAGGCQLEWPDRVERVSGIREKLGDYLHARAQREGRLPRAVVTREKRYYL
jgi:hypothetical protein